MMKFLYDVPAPAKLNLFLHVTGRRADGYHLLQTAMVLIDWCDTLHFELRAGGAISRQDLGTPLPADDLIVRAARALQRASGSTQGVHIQVDKRIPSQAGMGGGSSDAASTLLALQRLWKLDLPLKALASIGLQLGADVPFFLSGSHAWVEGVGEKISPFEIPVGPFVVVKPPEGLDTRLIFSDPSLKRDTDTAILTGFAGNPQGFGRNDMQVVAQKFCPGVSQALEWLAAQGLNGRMTGSGSAVFAWAGADVALNAAPAGFEVRRCSGLRVHPLKGWARI